MKHFPIASKSAVLLLFFALGPRSGLRASELVREDFVYGSTPSALTGLNGGTGLLGNWSGSMVHQYLPSSLAFSDLSAFGGAVSMSGTAAIQRRLTTPIPMTGVFWGSYIFRLETIPGSPLWTASLLLGQSNDGDSAATFTAEAHSYGNNTCGARVEGANADTALPGSSLAGGTNYLYLFRADPVNRARAMTVWVLTPAQYDHFKPGGLTEEELNTAGLGTTVGTVLERGQVNATGRTLAPVGYMQLTAYLAPKVTVDRIRISSTSLNAAVTDAVPVPEIVVEQAGGTDIPDGGYSGSFPAAAGGFYEQTFTVRNVGSAALSLSGITIDGPDANQFSVVESPGVNPLVPAGGTSFTVRFTPAASGIKTANLHFTTNDPDESAFDITLMSERPGDPDGLVVEEPGVNAPSIFCVQPDGKTILAGRFAAVHGVPRGNIARLNTDGTLDTGFDPKANGDVVNVALQRDGKILIAGRFSGLQPNGSPTFVTRSGMARLNADGTLDPDFDPRGGSYISLQPDDKIVLSGQFSEIYSTGVSSPVTRNRMARLHPDGTLDLAFDPNADEVLNRTALQPDGKILVLDYTTFQPNGATTRSERRIVSRLNADGTLDHAFHPNPNESPICVAVQPDGKILMGGYFSLFRPNGAAVGTPRGHLARLHPDGTLDPSFTPVANNLVTAVTLQADGKILISGTFTAIRPTGALFAIPRRHLARLHPDGTLDASFDPNPDKSISSLVLRADGKILVGGSFTSFQPNGAVAPTARRGFALLRNGGAFEELSAPDSSQVLFKRGGTAPEVSDVMLERSTDGGLSWTGLGAATRVDTTADWRLTGITLPSGGLLRARARATSGLVETVAGFHFGGSPDIAVSVDAALEDGEGSVDFGSVPIGDTSSVKTFTIQNPGTAPLTGLAITKGGANAGDFLVSDLSGTGIPAGEGKVEFTVTFRPSAGGIKSGVLHLSSNVAGMKNPYDIHLTGTGLAGPPVFSGFVMHTTRNTRADTDTAAIVSRVQNAGAAAISAVSASTAQGGTVAREGDVITFSPRKDFTGLDSFEIVITDGQGGNLPENVIVLVREGNSNEASGETRMDFQPGGSLALLFYAVPGRTYQMQRSDDLENWSTLRSVPAASDGTLPFVDTAPLQGKAFYRAVSP